jgi:hypothetical protein
MASRRPPKAPAPPPVSRQFEDAEKTSVDFAPPELDLDEPTEDTDKNLIPALAKKLKLSLPEEIKSEPKPAPKPEPAKPVKPAPLKRIKLLRVAPEKSSSKLVLGIVGALMAIVGIAFAVVPDGKTQEEIAKREGRQAWEMSESGKRPYFSYKDRIQIEHPEMIVRAPIATGEAIQPAPPPENPAPPKLRHAPLTKAPAPTPKEGDVRYGFERTQQPKRAYDNYDATWEKGNGIPMLMVFSEPRGMSVDVDGRIAGVTPLLRALPKDTKRVKVRLYGAGFKEVEQTVTPNQIEQFRVGVTMQRIAE